MYCRRDSYPTRISHRTWIVVDQRGKEQSGEALFLGMIVLWVYIYRNEREMDPWYASRPPHPFYFFPVLSFPLTLKDYILYYISFNEFFTFFMKAFTFSLVYFLAGLTSALYVPVSIERRDSLSAFNIPSQVGFNFISSPASNQPAIQNDHDLLVSHADPCFISSNELISENSIRHRLCSAARVSVSWLDVSVTL